MSENIDLSERMTGTPSKDRAEAARDLGLDLMLCTEAEEAILKASRALDNAFAEGMKRAAEIAQGFRRKRVSVKSEYFDPCGRWEREYNYEEGKERELIAAAILAEIERR